MVASVKSGDSIICRLPTIADNNNGGRYSSVERDLFSHIIIQRLNPSGLGFYAHRLVQGRKMVWTASFVLLIFGIVNIADHSHSRPGCFSPDSFSLTLPRPTPQQRELLAFVMRISTK